MPSLRNYRMTPDELVRFIVQYDPLGELPREVARVVKLVNDHRGHRVNLGYGGATLDYDGFIWIRTSRPVDWM